MKNSFLFAFAVLGIYLSNAEPLQPSDCKCRLDVSSRIVGGSVLKSTIPWMASIGLTTCEGCYANHFCAGFILNHNWIVTAARCIEMFRTENIPENQNNVSTIFGGNPVQVSNIRVTVGTNDLREDPKNYQILSVEKVLIDGRYSHSNPEDQVGIGLIKLADSITFNKNVQPACLPKKGEHYNDRPGSLQAVGFGSVKRILKDIKRGDETGAEISYKLKSALFNYLYPRGGDDHLIRTKPLRLGDSICVGDFGGPLMHNQNGYSRVVGISQYVEELKDGDYVVSCHGPAGHTRISYYLDLIESVSGIGKDYCAEK